MLKYAVYLDTRKNGHLDWTETNDYGYWTGKDYKHQEECFPVTDSNVSDRTKLYSRSGDARNACNTCQEKYGYVKHTSVIQITI